METVKEEKKKRRRRKNNDLDEEVSLIPDELKEVKKPEDIDYRNIVRYHPLGLLYEPSINKLFKIIMESYPPLVVKRIARIIGKGDAYVKRRLKMMKDYGFSFMVDFEQRRIGLVNICVILKKPYKPGPTGEAEGLSEIAKWLLRWQVNTMNPGSIGILFFYAPNDQKQIQALVDVLEESLDVARIFVADINVYAKPELWTLRVTIDDKLLTDWRVVVDPIIESYRRGDLPSIPPVSSRSVDFIDVIALSFLQKDAFTSLDKIASFLKIDRVKVKKHIESHLHKSGVITGTTLHRYPMPTNNYMAHYFITGRAEPQAVALAVNVLRKTFGFRGATFNSLTGDFAIHIVESFPPTNLFAENMYRLAEVLGCYNTFLLDPSTIKSYTIPFLVFSRDVKSWVLEMPVLEFMKRKLELLMSKTMPR